MREVREGDVVFHFVDNKELRGVSVAGSKADETFTGVEGTEWAGRASYRIPLREYRQLTPPIHRSDFLADNNYRSRISNMLEQHRGLFFNREFNLNQGSYLTEAPIELVQLWDEIYRQKAGDALLPGIDLGSVSPVKSSTEPAIRRPLDAKSVDAFEQALRDAGVVVSRTLVIRMLSSLVSKNLLLLTGLAGSGKTKIAQALAHWLPSSSNCFRVVAVGADWTGNENILGYPNGLEKASYISKPSLDVILHAKANQAIPHFLILDEMNLSHVERYFADILSAIESDEKIHLHQDSERKANGTTIPAEVELPKNLFIIGTVNVDETTYMFSPKVLDRANVIEFRMDAGELEGFLGNPAKPDLSKLDGKGASFGKTFVDAAKNAVAVPADVKAAYDAEMLLLFKTLQAHGAEFGYRTAYETARFIHFYKLLGNHADGDTTWFPGAFDCVVFQKLLPKLHGSRAKLGPVLKKLWFLCVNDAAGRGADALKAAEEAARSTDKKAEPTVVVPAGAPYPLSAEKIGRMWRLLIENGFASFAEA
jgi:5-methylcytosine-specific restriction protein B